MKAQILGNVQDGGVPHLGCECDVCETARENPAERKLISSVMLKQSSDQESATYLIDATPDIRNQIGTRYIDGVFIPLATLGHITGLEFFGPEGPDATELSVYCSSDVQEYMMENDPYRLLIDRDTVETHTVKQGDAVEIQGGSVEIMNFYHGHVNYQTTGYMVHGQSRKLFFLDDIMEFTEEIKDAIRKADVALVDGTFWSTEEIDRYEEVPHPPIRRSLDQLQGIDTDIYFTHMNHTNPVLREDSEERKEVKERGFNVAERGHEFNL